MPTIDKNAEAVKSFTKGFTTLFDQLVKAGGSEDFGEITPNTTSFSVVLFSGSDGAEEDPVFFEYHYVAPEAPQNSTLNSNTMLPLGTLTQLFTVYAWLVELGDEQWGKPITEYLPELNRVSKGEMKVQWDDITVGSLAGQMSGLARESYSCVLSKSCGRDEFIDNFGSQPPLFLPDTTPIISNAAFQLLALALEANKLEGSGNTTFDSILATGVFGPLNMMNSGLLSSLQDAKVSALSMISTTSDLARAGHAMLSSRLVSPATTRRWLQPVADTSNLRNSVGRPWEIYHAGQYANSSVLDVFTKTGLIGHYASYFGLAPDFNAGFTILAHDTEAARGPDLNVYADIVSLAIVQLQRLAATEATARYVGTFGGSEGVAAFNTSRDGPGLLVTTLEAGEINLRAQIAESAGIKLEDLDFRLYPSNVGTKTQHQFVAVFQDKSAPVDMGTPTCITWQDVDSLGSSVDVRVVFTIDAFGKAINVTLNGGSLSLGRSA
ncbi:uncharacterized protein N0V96_011436 [Colletotrichum fioriniae]|uniref:uncharacterized protein n=1 Tax=Colletotrichum fioriniae TaxID=710243 RepID=UPI0032DA7468|nr:hypothetical protein N0V96_011436 [Colletotrichum fioriniae]